MPRTNGQTSNSSHNSYSSTSISGKKVSHAGTSDPSTTLIYSLSHIGCSIACLYIDSPPIMKIFSMESCSDASRMASSSALQKKMLFVIPGSAFDDTHIFNRPRSGLLFILSNVFLPIITALRNLGFRVSCVIRLKYAISSFIDHGNLPFNPIPRSLLEKHAIILNPIIHNSFIKRITKERILEFDFLVFDRVQRLFLVGDIFYVGQ